MSRRALVPLLLILSLAVPGSVSAVDWPPSSGLLVGEVVTGGATGADEYIELFNAGAAAVSLAGLELVYASASGKSVTRKQQWGGGQVPGGGRLLLANVDGTFATAADHTYSGGLSATGGSVVLRTQGGPVVDALSWGAAASGFVEGTAAAAPPAGSSVERKPGAGAANSRDTNDNAADTRTNEAPRAEGSSGGPVVTPRPTPDPTPKPTPKPTLKPTPKPTPEPTPEPSPEPTPEPTPRPTPVPTTTPMPRPTEQPTPRPTAEPTSPPRPTPTATPAPTDRPRPTAEPTPIATERPTPEPMPTPSARPTPSPDPTPTAPATLAIATARTRAIGSEVTVEGTVTAEPGRILGERTLVLQDATGGLPVRLPSVGLVGDYPRGTIVRVTGDLAEPYGNLELRPANDDDLTAIGSGGLPDAESLQSDGLAEANEGLLASLTATLEAVDRYQSGAVSIVVGDASGSGKVYAFAPVGLQTAGLERGQRIRALGIVGQRASSSGAGDGHRLWLRGSADLTIVAPAPTPTPSAAPGDGDPTQPRPRRVRIADAVEGETVVIVGVVTSRAGLIHSEGRRVTVQDPSGAILVRYPSDANPDRVGSVIRAVGKVGTWFDARQLEADKKPRRKRSGRVRVTDLRRPPGEAQEWRLVRVSVRITDVERDGDSWRAEAALAGGQRLPIVGLAGSGIDGDLLEPGRSARITGLVKRAHPAATDQRFAIAPRSRKDIRLGRLQPVDDEGDGADDGGPGEEDEDDGLVGAAGGSGPAVFAATFGRLDGLEDRLVRVGGRVSQIAGQRLTLDDGTAEGVVRLADSVEHIDPAIRVGEIVNAVGRVERLRRRGHEVVVTSGSDVRRAARLAGPDSRPSAPVAPVDPPGHDFAGAHAEPPQAAPVLPLLLVTGVLGLLATSLLAAAGFVHRRASRPVREAEPEAPSVGA